jgi:hypothetical protein
MVPNIFGKSAFNWQQQSRYQIHDKEGTGEYEQHLKRDYYGVDYLCHGKPPFEAADRFVLFSLISILLLKQKLTSLVVNQRHPWIHLPRLFPQ